MPAVVWRKSAVKDVRPFFGVASLEACLDAAQTRLREAGPYSSDQAFVIEQADADKLAVCVRLNLNPAVMDHDAAKKGLLALAITASQPFMKKTCVVASLPLNKSLPDEIAIGDEVLAALGGGSNMDIEVALCLSKNLAKRPGAPFLKGHWLAKKRFSLRPPKLAEEFDIEPTEDDQFVKLGYPAKTLYLVEYFGGFNEPVAKDRQTARVRVHADIYKKLTAESSQRLAKPILNGLAAEIACQMLAASLSDWEGADEVVAQSPLSAFLKRVNRIQACDLEGLKALAKSPGMPKLRALLHSDQATVRSIAES